jgi:hypothetical protein
VISSGKKCIVAEVLFSGNEKKGKRDYITVHPVFGGQTLTRTRRCVGVSWEHESESVSGITVKNLKSRKMKIPRDSKYHKGNQMKFLVNGKYLYAQEAADYFKCHRTHLRNWVKEFEIDYAIKLGLAKRKKVLAPCEICSGKTRNLVCSDACRTERAKREYNKKNIDTSVSIA